MRRLKSFAILTIAVASVHLLDAGSQPIRTRKGMVISASGIASQIGAGVLRDGGNAIDAAVATAFALAVTHPVAGNIGGGGFLVFRSATGDAIAYDFRETAPTGSLPTMFLKSGKYDSEIHHRSHLSVGVPGTVAGLHLAWRDHGKLPWKRLVDPATRLAREGFVVSIDLARSLRGALEQMKPYPASVAQFSKGGVPYEAGDILKQSDLAGTLQRIAAEGPAGFYEGETALLIEKEITAHGGLITRSDLRAYQARKRIPVRSMYRGHEIISMPPSSSGGIALVQMLNILEGYDLTSNGYGSAQNVHLIAESHAQGIRRPSSASWGSRFQSADANRPARLEGIRAKAAANNRFESRVHVVSDDVLLAAGEYRNNTFLCGGRSTQCRGAHVYP